jgi:hypothetical protein
MNDDKIERLLRQLPVPELPASWRTEILTAARREASAERSSRPAWPPILLWLRNAFARNPVTSGVLATLWLLIFLFRFTTPVDPAEKEMMAHTDTNKPVYLLTMADEIRLVEAVQDQPPQPERIP